MREQGGRFARAVVHATRGLRELRLDVLDSLQRELRLGLLGSVEG
jgi:hypothetical protein